jgi:hypothetical protein
MSTSRRAKSAQRALDLAEQAQLHAVIAQPSRLASLIEQSGQPTRLQRQIATEAVTRAGSIEATGLLHEWASQHIARAHLISHSHVFANVRRLNSAMATPMDPVTAEDMNAWTSAQKEMLFRHESTLLNGMVSNIVVIATKPLPEKAEPEGLLDMLLGRR